MIKIQIKSIYGSVLFEYEKENNTIKDTLIEAVKKGADLRDAYLSGANLSGAKGIPYIPLACPSDGTFIGWKKIAYDYLVMLEIPEDARRCSATTQKCRCDKARVLGITNIKTNEVLESVVNSNFHETTYTVGEMVYSDSFDEDRWNECSHGIHFFINKQDALDY